jgi:hypothetical protein
MTFQKSFVLAVMGIITLCLSSCFEEDKYVVPMLFQGFCDVNDSSFIDNYEGKYNSAVIHPIYETYMKGFAKGNEKGFFVSLPQITLKPYRYGDTEERSLL